MFDSLFLSHSLPTNRLASHAALPNFHGKLGEKMDFWRDYAILSIKPRMHLCRHFLFSLPCRLPFFSFFFIVVQKKISYLYNGYTLGKFLSVKYIFYCVHFIYFSVNQYFSSGFRQCSVQMMLLTLTDTMVNIYENIVKSTNSNKMYEYSDL